VRVLAVSRQIQSLCPGRAPELFLERALVSLVNLRIPPDPLQRDWVGGYCSVRSGDGMLGIECFLRATVSVIPRPNLPRMSQ